MARVDAEWSMLRIASSPVVLGIEAKLAAVPTVLIVDDDRDIREALSGALAGEGYAVCEAIDGEDALGLLTSMEIPPHLVLLDMMMPRMNGHEFLEAIARRPEFDALPVVVVSAYQNLALARACAVMEKPIDLEALLTLVAAICGERPLFVEKNLKRPT